MGFTVNKIRNMKPYPNTTHTEAHPPSCTPCSMHSPVFPFHLPISSVHQFTLSLSFDPTIFLFSFSHNIKTFLSSGIKIHSPPFSLWSTFPRLCREASWEPCCTHFSAFSSVATQCRVVCSHRHLFGQDLRRALSPISGNLPKWILNGQTLSTMS